MRNQRKFVVRAAALAALIQLMGTGINQAAPPVTSENFDVDPLWVSSNNTASPNNYGFANSSHITGSSAGEAGGTLGNASLSYYGDPAADGLTLYTNFTASGKLTVDASGGFSGANFLLGWFDRDETSFPTLLGLRFVDPQTGSSPFRAQLVYVRPGTGGDTRDTGTFITLDTGKDYDWTFSYDPDGGGGVGSATTTFTGIDVVDVESQTLILHPSDKPRGSVFDTFGILKNPGGSGTADFFIDNLQYTIPEPSSLALAGFLLTIAILSRKATA